MMNQPTPEVQQRLRAMCAQMAVVQHLDDEIQRELYGHMEDKLLAYLNGEETMTEEDALILVREHFGDPVVVKGLLHAAHPMAAASHFLRRVVAVICVETVFMFFAGIGITALLLFVPAMAEDATGSLFLYAALPALCRLPVAYLIWVTLRFWQGRIDQGHSAWFLEYPVWLVACIGLIIGGAGLVLPIGHASAAMVTPTIDSEWTYSSYTLLVSMFFAVWMGAVWIWWCDRPPRLKRSMASACGVWALYEFLGSLPPIAVTAWVLSRGEKNGLDPLFVPGLLAYVRDGAPVVVVSGILAMGICAALRGIARRRTRIA
jgi:hypothetical protein